MKVFTQRHPAISFDANSLGSLQLCTVSRTTRGSDMFRIENMRLTCEPAVLSQSMQDTKSESRSSHHGSLNYLIGLIRSPCIWRSGHLRHLGSRLLSVLQEFWTSTPSSITILFNPSRLHVIRRSRILQHGRLTFAGFYRVQLSLSAFCRTSYRVWKAFTVENRTSSNPRWRILAHQSVIQGFI